MSISYPEIKPRRVVQINADYPYDHQEIQSSYLDPITRKLYPSTDVYFGETLYYRVNSLGGKGDELEPDKPIIGVFGDSSVQGAGPLDSWVHDIRVDGYQTFNGGIEGSPLEYTVDRIVELCDKVDIRAVVIHPGWHNIFYGERSDRHWIAQFDRLSALPLVVHLTLDADFHLDLIKRPATTFRDGSDLNSLETYLQWPGIEYTSEGFEKFRMNVDHKNRVIRRYCAERGRPLIDLSEVRPRTLADRGARHFDLIHLRPSAHAMVGAIVAKGLKPLLPSLDEESVASEERTAKPRHAAAAAGTPKVGARSAGTSYPLW